MTSFASHFVRLIPLSGSRDLLLRVLWQHARRGLARGLALSLATQPMLALAAPHSIAAQPIRPLPAGIARAENRSDDRSPRTMASRPGPSTPTSRVSGARVIRYAIMGAITGTALALGYYAISEKGQRGGDCQPLTCALPYLTVSGALAGLFLGRELEGQRIALAPRAGNALHFASVEAALLATPIAFDLRDTLIALVGDSGVQLLSTSATNASAPRVLRRRAAGLGSLRDIAIVPARDLIAIATGTGLWEAPLVTGPAMRVVEGAVTALAASETSVLSATGRMVRVRRGLASSRESDSLDIGAPVTAAAYDVAESSWWVATDAAIVNVRETTSGLVVALTLPFTGDVRRIAISSQWIAAAAGTDGIVAWSRSALREAMRTNVTPVAARLRDEPRYAYDVAVLGDTAYVAGGVDGLFRVDLAATPTIVGSSNQFEYATSVRIERGVLWVGDRSRRTLIRVQR